MVKFYLTLYFIFLFSITIVAQTVEVFENFSTYDGTTLTVPAQWIFSDHGVFTDMVYSGNTGPNAYKFTTDKSSITTPYFDASDSVSFYLKDSASAPSTSVLIVLATKDSVTWDTLSKVTDLPVYGSRLVFRLLNTMHQLKFVFLKSSPDNLAFDDFYITRKSSATADFFGKTVCYGDTSFFEDWSTSLSSGGATVKWFWKFDDGGTDSVQNPFHTYKKAGTYSVQLKIKNARGDLDSATKFCLVFPRPSENFSSAATGPCTTRCLQFTDKSSIAGGGADEDQALITSWIWDIAGTSYTVPSPLHCFKFPGTYTISLTATADNGCGGHTEKSSVIIPSGIQAGFTYVLSDKGKYTFTGTVSGETPPITYQWLFGDGDSSNMQSPTHTFVAAADYSVCFTASTAYGCDTECQTIKVASPLGLEDATNPIKLLIYPNPTAEKLKIQSTEPGVVSLYNALGAMVLQKQIISTYAEIDVADLPDGNYSMQLRTKTSSLFKSINLLH